MCAYCCCWCCCSGGGCCCFRCCGGCWVKVSLVCYHSIIQSVSGCCCCCCCFCIFNFFESKCYSLMKATLNYGLNFIKHVDCGREVSKEAHRVLIEKQFKIVDFYCWLRKWELYYKEIYTKKHAVFVRLKAKCIGREKKRKIINLYCGLLRRFKRKFFILFFFVFVCVLLLLLLLVFFSPLTIMKVRKAPYRTMLWINEVRD